MAGNLDQQGTAILVKFPRTMATLQRHLLALRWSRLLLLLWRLQLMLALPQGRQTMLVHFYYSSSRVKNQQVVMRESFLVSRLRMRLVAQHCFGS